MSKKTSNITHARIRTHDGRHISTTAAFPADQHVATNPQRELPNPAVALAGLDQPSERARLRAATVSQEQRDARARREALALIEREDARRDAQAFAPTVREDLQAVRRRPIDAPMATRIGALPDPLAALAWDAIVEDAAETASKWWDKWQFSMALAAWSVACFALGMLV